LATCSNDEKAMLALKPDEHDLNLHSVLKPDNPDLDQAGGGARPWVWTAASDLGPTGQDMVFFYKSIFHVDPLK
jgi:hypothetical protein